MHHMNTSVIDIPSYTHVSHKYICDRLYSITYIYHVNTFMIYHTHASRKYICDRHSIKHMNHVTTVHTI